MSTMFKCLASLVAPALLVGAAVAVCDGADAAKATAPPIVIHIVPGSDEHKAKYIKEGDTTQRKVEVTVGQTVRWVNKGTMTHTATAAKKAAGKRVVLFDTDDIEPGEMKEVQFDEALYKKAAGATAGGPATIDYVCLYHRGMKSAIVLKPAAARPARDLR